MAALQWANEILELPSCSNAVSSLEYFSPLLLLLRANLRPLYRLGSEKVTYLRHPSYSRTLGASRFVAQMRRKKPTKSF